MSLIQENIERLAQIISRTKSPNDPYNIPSDCKYPVDITVESPPLRHGEKFQIPTGENFIFDQNINDLIERWLQH